MLEDGSWTLPDAGVPQGATVSPLLANVYLNYVFDLWAREGLSSIILEAAQSVSDWAPARPRTTCCLIGGRTEVALSTVVQHLNDRIRFTADILDIVFIEKLLASPASRQRSGRGSSRQACETMDRRR